MIDDLLSRFCPSESFSFYNGEVELLYDKAEHKYTLIQDGELIDIPSVTQVTHIIDKSPILLPWACKVMAEKVFLLAKDKYPLTNSKLIPLVNQAKLAHKEHLEQAGDIGATVHNYIECWIKWKLNIFQYEPSLPDNEKAVNCVNAALQWIKAHNVRFLTTETKVYSKIHKYAGTFDAKALIDSCADKLCCPTEYKDRLGIIDWKSSSNLYLEMLLQVSGYVLAYLEEFPNEPIEDFWLIHLGRETGQFNPWHISDTNELELYQYGFLNALRLFHSVEYAQEAVTQKNNKIKFGRKQEKQRLKEEQLRIKCAYADKYKAVRRPNCNNGNPCETCTNKWNTLHP